MTGFSRRFETLEMKTIAKVSLVFSPAIFVGFLVAFNSVNIPVWDDWERGVLLEKYYAKSPEFFSYLGSAHIDHRMIVPRVLIVLINELTGGNL